MSVFLHMHVAGTLTLEFVSCIVGHFLDVISDCLQVILRFWEREEWYNRCKKKNELLQKQIN